MAYRQSFVEEESCVVMSKVFRLMGCADWSAHMKLQQPDLFSFWQHLALSTCLWPGGLGQKKSSVRHLGIMSQ